MKQVMVRYSVKPEHAARNEELVRRVYAELHETAPNGIRYVTFALEDGVSFVHLASFDGDDDGNPLMEVAAFRAFQEGIAERTDVSPQALNLREIGSYGMFPSARPPGQALVSR